MSLKSRLECWVTQVSYSVPYIAKVIHGFVCGEENWGWGSWFILNLKGFYFYRNESFDLELELKNC